jgi:hypothetical protein
VRDNAAASDIRLAAEEIGAVDRTFPRGRKKV